MTGTAWRDSHEVTLTTERGGTMRTFSFLTRDGLLSKSEVRATERALLGAVERPGRDALVLDANYGVVATVLARLHPGTHVTMTETSARAAECCRTNADRNEADNVDVELVPWAPTGSSTYDRLLFAPKPYAPTAVNRERLVRGLSSVAPGGHCYVAGTKSTGIDAYVETLDSFCEEVKRVETDADCAVYRATRPAEFTPTGQVDEREFRANVGEYTCRFVTLPGLFSWTGLDAGTEALLRHVSVPEGSRTLDLACGYGPVGAFVGARTDCDLYATDDSVLATEFARRNYERNGVTPVAVETGDCLDPFLQRTFDVIVLNPPTHAGKGVTMKMFQSARDVLDDDGKLWLVYNEIMNYDRLLRSKFGFEVDVVASVGKFEVTVARP
jgi:16S rRNA (guanine1207-N2)-methyltransferase